ncbi:hypothetical protein ACG7TL_003060 [Trametes sanguinea]
MLPQRSPAPAASILGMYPQLSHQPQARLNTFASLSSNTSRIRIKARIPRSPQALVSPGRLKPSYPLVASSSPILRSHQDVHSWPPPSTPSTAASSPPRNPTRSHTSPPHHMLVASRLRAAFNYFQPLSFQDLARIKTHSRQDSLSSSPPGRLKSSYPLFASSPRIPWPPQTLASPTRSKTFVPGPPLATPSAAASSPPLKLTRPHTSPTRHALVASRLRAALDYPQAPLASSPRAPQDPSSRLLASKPAPAQALVPRPPRIKPRSTRPPPLQTFALAFTWVQDFARSSLNTIAPAVKILLLDHSPPLPSLQDLVPSIASSRRIPLSPQDLLVSSGLKTPSLSSNLIPGRSLLFYLNPDRSFSKNKVFLLASAYIVSARVLSYPPNAYKALWRIRALTVRKPA